MSDFDWKFFASERGSQFTPGTTSIKNSFIYSHKIAQLYSNDNESLTKFFEVTHLSTENTLF